MVDVVMPKGSTLELARLNRGRIMMVFNFTDDVLSEAKYEEISKALKAGPIKLVIEAIQIV